MSKSKYIDNICLFFLILALLVTVVFMKGEALGIQVISEDTDSESDESSYFTDRDFDSSWNESDVTYIYLADDDTTLSNAEGAYYASGVVTIAEEGTYVIEGTLTDGQVVVEASPEAKVQIVLDRADIVCSDGPALYIKEADKVFITLADGTENQISCGNTFSDESVAKDMTGAVYSKVDLTINGTGNLAVTGNYKHGIMSKKDLVVTEGNISVTAISDGIRGKESVRICGGTFVIDAGSDGIQSSDTEEGKGYVYIGGGTFTITAGCDGVQAEQDLLVCGGEFQIATGGGSANAVQKAKQDNFMMGKGGNFASAVDSTSESANSTTSDTSDSHKSLKAETLIKITGGTFTLDSAEDGIHSNGDISISGGLLEIASGDDGIHAEGAVSLNGCTLKISESYEGIEGKTIAVLSGVFRIVSDDDAMNASNGSQSGFGGEVQSGASLTISGGYVYVDAGGDGLDSNGTLNITGGEVLVCRPSTDNGNGTLDSGSTLTLSGGVVVTVANSVGMQESFSNDSQYTVWYTFAEQQEAGTRTTLTTKEGQVIASFAPEESYQIVMISAPELAQQETYILYTGGEASGVNEYGFAESGTITGGTVVTETTVSTAAVNTGGKNSNFGGPFGQGNGKKAGK